MQGHCAWSVQPLHPRCTLDMTHHACVVGVAADERSFQARYGRTVAAARFSRKGSKESDASLLVLDQLHKQVCVCGGGGRVGTPSLFSS